MPARVNVFCKRAVEINAEWLRQVLAGADLMTMAEFLDPPPEDEEALVDEMWELFRIDRAAPPLELYWSKEHRPIQLSIYDDELRSGVISETIDEVDDDSPGAERVRQHVAETKQIVGFELGFAGADGLGGILVEELAYAIAEKGDGLIWFWHRAFASPEDRCATIWQRPTTA